MVLFVVDQIAGAEYVHAVILEANSSHAFDWEIVASNISSIFFSKLNIPHRMFDNISLEEAQELVREIQPSKALVSTSFHSSLENVFVTVLKEQKIPCIQFIDVWTNYKMRFESVNESGEPSWLFPDQVLTLDENARLQMIEEGIPAEIIQVAGQPHFEIQMRKYAATPRVKYAARPRILLVTQPIARFYGKTLGYDEFSFITCCLEGTKAANIDWNDVDLVIHPAEESAPYNTLVKKYSNLIRIIPNSELRVPEYGRMLGMFSSLLVQGVLAGIKVCSVQPGAVGPNKSFLPQVPTIHSAEDVSHWLSGEFRSEDTGDGRFLDPKMLEGSSERIIKILKD